jgi:putative ubiquitin-RnfH superfamily antitoxin RatB of RatAB toxin-antitoxin module
MKVEVVYALPQEARYVTVELGAAGRVRDAILKSGLLPADAILEKTTYGVFGKRVPLDHPLAEGDRVEIYRALAMDPKEARRRRAAKKR